MLDIVLMGQHVGLHASGAVYLRDHDTLLVADAHFGKAMSFRRLGLPVPSGTTAQTLAVLSGAVRDSDARSVVFLGDFLHSSRAQVPHVLTALADWRVRHGHLALTLVRGNHDAHAGDPPDDLDLNVVNEPLRLGPFALCHHPRPVPGAYVLAGHWHPCVTVRGHAHDRVRLPCFWFGDEKLHPVGVLPAFGDFTGMHGVQDRPGDRLYAVAQEHIRQVATRTTPRA